MYIKITAAERHAMNLNITKFYNKKVWVVNHVFPYFLSYTIIFRLDVANINITC